LRRTVHGENIRRFGAKEGIVAKKVLTATEILDAPDIQVVDIDVPEWGGIVKLRPMSAEESIAYNEAVKAGDRRHGAVILAATCLVDENGKQLFTEDQARGLVKKSLAALLRIQKVALRVNGFAEDEVKETKND
jgi:hypothetical protein